MFCLGLMTWRLYLPRNQEAKDEPVFFLILVYNGCKTFMNKLWPAVQFYFSNMSSPRAVSVAIWIPSFASTPQVGFSSMTTSSIRER